MNFYYFQNFCNVRNLRGKFLKINLENVLKNLSTFSFQVDLKSAFEFPTWNEFIFLLDEFDIFLRKNRTKN